MAIKTSRRSVMKATAWTMPALTVAAAAPAVAASAGGSPQIGVMVQFNDTANNISGIDGFLESADGILGYDLNSASTTFSNPTLTFWLQWSGVTWTNTSGSGDPTTDANWVAPSPTGATRIVNGVTYYAYAPSYVGAILDDYGPNILRTAPFRFGFTIPGAASEGANQSYYTDIAGLVGGTMQAQSGSSTYVSGSYTSLNFPG